MFDPFLDDDIALFASNHPELTCLLMLSVVLLVHLLLAAIVSASKSRKLALSLMAFQVQVVNDIYAALVRIFALSFDHSELTG